MNRWQRVVLTWILPALGVGLCIALFLTNGLLGDFFRTTAWGSLLYANVWDHIMHGNLFIDPQYAPGEYFLVSGGHVVTYFGVMPVIIRGLGSILIHNVYAVNLTNLSMVLATLLAIGSVWYAVKRLSNHSPQGRWLGLSMTIMLLVGSPLTYLLVWSWTYHEVILWGLAWALLFTSLYTLWIFDRKHITRWHTFLMGLAVGMATLSRPTIGLTLIIPFGFLCVQACLDAWHRHRKQGLELLLPGIIASVILGLLVIVVNDQRWGSPFTFVRIDQNVQFVELYPQRRKDIQKAGEFNINRLPFSAYYYLVPSLGNVSRHFPFITLDRELNLMNHAPQYDYIEGSRVPITLSMTYLLVLAVLGALNFRKLKRQEKQTGYWLLGGAGLTLGALFTVYAVALRYSPECLPPVVFLGFVYLATLNRGSISPPNRRTAIALGVVTVISLYITIVTALAYKQFVWDVPGPTRAALQRFLHYSPQPNETKHIIDGKRFPVY